MGIKKRKKKKHTLHRIYFFMQPVYKTQIVLEREIHFYRMKKDVFCDYAF